MTETAPFPFDNTFARLPEHFFARLNPTPVASPALIKINRNLARQLGLDPDFLASPDGVEILAGNRIAEGSEPLAMAYAGQQFGGWVPLLGDGRAILLGEVVDDQGKRRDIQLKGCGRTPFSRSGDGRAWIGPILREYVVSEAMAALGIPTSRALSAVATGEVVYREQIFPGAVIARVASSHVRVGTFQFFASRRDLDGLRILADHVIDRHYPDARDAENPYLRLLESVVAQQAGLVAKWMAVGFIHGVLNTDNVLISGETLDYGPCAFIDTYHPEKVFSSIDRGGRYAYNNQPKITQWNLAAFASCLIPLIGPDDDKAVEAAEDVIATYSGLFEKAWSAALLAKIGLTETREGDIQLAHDLLNRMATNKADFTLTFRRLGGLNAEPGPADATVAELFESPEEFTGWAATWRQRLKTDARSDEARQSAMNAINPAYIPRNHRVEQMIQAAIGGDYDLFETLVNVLSNPFDEQPQNIDYQRPPQLDEIVHQTFCGT